MGQRYSFINSFNSPNNDILAVTSLFYLPDEKSSVVLHLELMEVDRLSAISLLPLRSHEANSDRNPEM